MNVSRKKIYSRKLYQIISFIFYLFIMGCCYYIEAEKCDCCGRSERLHMCKFSYWRDPSWRQHSYLDSNWNDILSIKEISDIKTYKDITKKYKIINEYWDYISEKEFWDNVKTKKKDHWKAHTTYNQSKYDSLWNYRINTEFS